MQTNFHARLIYTLAKDLVFQPTLDNYLNEYLHKTHSMGANLQELDLQLQQLSSQIEKERVRKKVQDIQNLERSTELAGEERKHSENGQNEKKTEDEERTLDE